MTQPPTKCQVDIDDDHDSMGEQTNLEPLQSLSLAGSIEMADASIVYKEPNSSQSVSSIFIITIVPSLLKWY